MSKANDKLLDEYLSGSTPYSSRYERIASHDVPGDLDRAVLEEAKRSIAKHRSRLWWRIAPAVAVAATAVFAISIVMRNEVEHETTMPAAISDQTIDKVDVPRPEVPSPEQKAIEAVAAHRNVENEHKRAAARFKKEAPPESGAVLAERVAANASAELQPQAPRAESAPAAAPSVHLEPPPVAQRSIVLQAPPANETQIASAKEAQTPLQPSAMQGAKPSDTSFQANGRIVRKEDKPPPMDVVSEARLRSDPEVWLKHIRDLRDAGRDSEADTQWRAFLQAFPNYAVSKADRARPKQ